MPFVGARRALLSRPPVVAAGGGGLTSWTAWNPGDKDANITLSGSNLIASDTSGLGAHHAVRSALGKASGKWYWEITISALGGSVPIVGVGTSAASLANYVGSGATSWGYASSGNKHSNAVATAYGATYTTGDVIGVALDMDAGTIGFYKNGVSQGQAYTGLTGTVFAMQSMIPPPNAQVTANFGASTFAFSVPAGYQSGLGT